MKKNMYSLMLSEEVVSVIDRLAHESGTNRSGMINNILAEYVSYRTPEMRMRQMCEAMERLLSPIEGFKVVLRSSDSLLSLRSALTFKYNPVIHYSVELFRSVSDTVGELRAGLRTQNVSLKLAILQFYKLWAKLERGYTGGTAYSIDGEKFTKRLVLRDGAAYPGQLTEEELSEAIVGYIYAFDSALKAFFYNLDDAEAAVTQTEGVYNRYRAGGSVLL